MNKFIIFLLLTLLSKPVFSKHITGGEIIYDCINKTATSRTYKITLILFRDEYCTQCPIMPANVRLGIFNNDNNTLINRADKSLDFIQDVPIINTPSCIVNAPTLRYTAGYYTTIITLDNNNNGYNIVYETCCRIQNITNIDNGTQGAGATYSTIIPGNNQLGINGIDNCPRFKNAISIICFNHYFTLDFSAQDPDNDQLVYSLCNGYDGEGSPDVIEDPKIPIDKPLTYQPGYSGNTPLGPQVNINAATGVISGIAPLPGKYVVSVCVQEFRNGRYLATHRKDFIITVADCDFPSADLLPEYLNCGNDSSFTFKNLNNSILNQTYLWEFGDPTSLSNNTSILENPTHAFTDTGIFKIKLVINKNDVSCVDSAESIVKIYPNFKADFSNSSPVCTNSIVQFNDLSSTGNNGRVISWLWDFGVAGTNSDTSINNPRPTYTYNQLGTYTVRLIAMSEKGCKDTLIGTAPDKLVYIVDKPVIHLSRDTLMCKIDQIQLNASSNSTGTFTWQPNYNINNLNISNPIVHPAKDTVYYVKFIDNTGCTNTDSIKIKVVDTVSLRINHDTTICRNDSIQLVPISNGLSYYWTPNISINNTNIKTPTVKPISPVIKYTIKATIGSCFKLDTIRVNTVPYPSANAGKDTSICFGDNAFFIASGGSRYLWNPTIYLNNTTSFNPIAVQPNEGIYKYIVTVWDSLGCPKPSKDSLFLNVVRVIADAGPKDTFIVKNQSIQLIASGGNIYNWWPNTWLSNATIYNPITNAINDITYYLKVSNNIGCFDYDSIHVKYLNVQPDFFVPNAFSPNNDGVNDIIKPICPGLRSIEYFGIYNRWGKLLFETSSIGVGWNGKYNGLNQDAGTYIWVATGTDYLNRTLQKKGTFILIR